MAAREYGNREFGALLDGARKRRGWSKSKLAREINDYKLPLSHRVFDAAGVNRLVNGGSVRLDHELVRCLLDLCGEKPDPGGAPRFTPEVAWPMARLWPDRQDEDAVIRYYRADAALVAAGALSDLGERAIPPCHVLAGQGRRARPGRGVLVRHTRRVTASA